jgi:hypothetical protein
MSKQTAVEWLYERLERMIPRTELYNIDKKHYLEEAKQMEKEQIVDAYIEGDRTAIKPEGEYKSLVIKDAEQYYQETFKQ